MTVGLVVFALLGKVLFLLLELILPLEMIIGFVVGDCTWRFFNYFGLWEADVKNHGGIGEASSDDGDDAVSDGEAEEDAELLHLVADIVARIVLDLHDLAGVFEAGVEPVGYSVVAKLDTIFQHLD